MSLCPAFYCSRCQVSHADECPPAASLPTKGLLGHYVAGKEFDGKVWKDQSGNGNDFVIVGAWNRLLTVAETQQVEAYIRKKYGPFPRSL